MVIHLFAGLSVSRTRFIALLESVKEDMRSLCIANYNILLTFAAFGSTVWCLFIRKKLYGSRMNISSVIRLASGVFFCFFYVYLKRTYTPIVRKKMAKA